MIIIVDYGDIYNLSDIIWIIMFSFPKKKEKKIPTSNFRIWCKVCRLKYFVLPMTYVNSSLKDGIKKIFISLFATFRMTGHRGSSFTWS